MPGTGKTKQGPKAIASTRSLFAFAKRICDTQWTSARRRGLSKPVRAQKLVGSDTLARLRAPLAAGADVREH